MRPDMTITVAQCPGDLDTPRDRLDWITSELSALPKTDLVLLPELFACGYNIGDAVTRRAEPRDGPFARAMSDLARRYDTALCYGYAECAGDTVHNSALCLDATGRPVANHRKLLLPPGFEADHFAPGRDATLFDLGPFRCGLLICYDVEFPENVRHLAAAGAELILVPTALGAEWGVVSDHLVPARAFENGVFVAYADNSGSQNGLAYFGGSCVAGPRGEVLARTERGPGIAAATLTHAAVASAQERLPYLRDRASLPWVTS